MTGSSSKKSPNNSFDSALPGVGVALNGSECRPALSGGDTGYLEETGFGGLDSRLNWGTTAPPRLARPRPTGLGFGARGAGCRGWVDSIGSDVCAKPAFSIAACSSALVGSLMGDFDRVRVGEADADCLLHNAVALFTETLEASDAGVESFSWVTSGLIKGFSSAGGLGMTDLSTGFGVMEGNGRAPAGFHFSAGNVEATRVDGISNGRSAGFSNFRSSDEDFLSSSGDGVFLGGS